MILIGEYWVEEYQEPPAFIPSEWSTKIVKIEVQDRKGKGKRVHHARVISTAIYAGVYR